MSRLIGVTFLNCTHHSFCYAWKVTPLLLDTVILFLILSFLLTYLFTEHTQEVWWWTATEWLRRGFYKAGHSLLDSLSDLGNTASCYRYQTNDERCYHRLPKLLSSSKSARCKTGRGRVMMSRWVRLHRVVFINGRLSARQFIVKAIAERRLLCSLRARRVLVSARGWHWLAAIWDAASRWHWRQEDNQSWPGCRTFTPFLGEYYPLVST